ncbi:MAG: polysaccharide deacetylase family protein [Acidobacteriota bacterium]
MIGRATLKRTIKQTAGWAAVLSQPFASNSAGASACIFYYHRVADLQFSDSRIDDWNVTPKRFERHIATLAQFAEVVGLSDLRDRLNSRRSNDRPLVCLTFDDGYSSFYTQVLPILKRYKVPATAFVVTGAIGTAAPMPFDHWAKRNSSRVLSDSWRPLTWRELEDCLASGLVTIGAHSHRHLRGSQCTPAQMADEAGTSRELLRRRLGEGHIPAYAYPYGNTKLGDVGPEYISAVKAAGYELAVTTDLGLVGPGRDLFNLPRLEAHMTDSPWILKAKVKGSLLPYRLTDCLKTISRS